MDWEIKKHKKRVERAFGQREYLEKDLKKLRREKKLLVRSIENIKEAHVFLTAVANNTQEALKINISNIVSLAMRSIFKDTEGGQYDFVIDFDGRKGGKTEAKILFKIRSSETLVNPMEAAEGGAINVAAFALRPALWALSKKGSIRNVLIYDEPFENLSIGFKRQAAKFLSELSKRLNIQIIMITHSPEFESYANRVFKFKKVGGITRIERIDNEETML